MYEAIKKEIMDEFDITDLSNLTIEDAYEVLYRLTSRLSDMDDFSNSILKSIASIMDEGNSFEKAFEVVINNDYEFANFAYFKEAFNHFKDDLKDAFKEACKSVNPARSWSASIHWIFDHATITVNGAEYNIKQLKSLINKGDENYE